MCWRGAFGWRAFVVSPRQGWRWGGSGGGGGGCGGGFCVVPRRGGGGGGLGGGGGGGPRRECWCGGIAGIRAGGGPTGCAGPLWERRPRRDFRSIADRGLPRPP